MADHLASSKGHNDRAHDSGSGHGEAAPDFPFGEVIPEKNWQENLLTFVAAVTLVGLGWLFFIWQSVPLTAAVEPGAGHTQPRPATLDDQALLERLRQRIK